MKKVLLIDDDDKDIRLIEEYISNNFDESKIIFQSIHLERISGTTIKEINSEEQKIKTRNILETNWRDVDIFLIDMALMGLPDKNLASQQAINEFFSRKKKRVEQLKNKEKIVMIISGKLMMNCDLELSEKIREYIPIVNKPENQEESYIQKSLCQCTNYCDKSRNTKDDCLIDDCLKHVLQSYL